MANKPKKKRTSKKTSPIPSDHFADQTNVNPADIKDAIQKNQISQGEKGTPPPPPPEPEEKKTDPTWISHTIHTRYVFSNEERADMGLKLAEARSRVDGLKDDLKGITGSYKKDIQNIESEADKLGECIRMGHEMRPVECFVWLDRNTAMKYFYRQTDGRYVKTEAMTPADYQQMCPPYPKGRNPEEPIDVTPQKEKPAE